MIWHLARGFVSVFQNEKHNFIRKENTILCINDDFNKIIKDVNNAYNQIRKSNEGK